MQLIGTQGYAQISCMAIKHISLRQDITEILLKVAFNTINQIHISKHKDKEH